MITLKYPSNPKNKKKFESEKLNKKGEKETWN